MPNLYIGNIGNAPTRLKKMYVGDSSNNPVRLKKIWIGDQNNNPKLIFSEGVADGYIYDFDASTKQYNQNPVGSIINSVNGAPHAIQQWHLTIPTSTVWGLSSVEGRPISFNNRDYVCGRGGSFRLPSPVDDATLLMVQRLDTTWVGANEVFTNCCYFNEKGTYVYHTDYFTYTGEEIANLTYRKYDESFDISVSGAGGRQSSINRTLSISWLYTEGNTVKTRIKPFGGEPIIYSGTRTSLKQIQDIRVCDWAGGGVYALTGELYEFIIWPRLLTEDERIDTETFLFEKWG